MSCPARTIITGSKTEKRSSGLHRLAFKALAPALFGTVIVGPSAALAQASPNYSGDVLTRSTMTGDWGGVRNELAQKGVTFDINATQVLQGVVSGGKSHDWEGGGRGDMIVTVDSGKLGLWNGGYLTVEVEGNWGRGVNANTGSLMPVNTNQLFPIPGNTTAGIPAFNYVQFLTPKLGVVIGKLDAFGADQNEFAHGVHGKGDTEFMNAALNVNPLTLFASPYSPLVAGLTILPTGNPQDATISVLVLTSTATADSAGFNYVRSDDVSIFAEGRVRTNFFGLTGHQLIGGVVSNKQFTSIDQKIILDQGITVAKKTGTWVAYYNFDQYFYEPVKGSGNGIGVFARLGASDGNPNFLQYFGSVGVGGKGVFAGRPDDRFGIGYYYINISNPQLMTPFGDFRFLRDEHGLEAFYNFALTPWAHLTPNIQVIRGAQKQTLALLPADRKDIQTSTTAALRLGINF